MTQKHLVMAVSIMLFSGLLNIKGHAQEPPAGDQGAWQSSNRIETKGSLGLTDFLDEAPLHHFLGGGSVRIRIKGGLGLEPELSYLYRSEHDRDLLLIPNLVYEFRRRGRLIPYFIGGVGMIVHFEKWGPFEWSSKWRYATGGFGTKLFLTRRLFFAPEVRIGWEPSLRISGSLGYVIKRNATSCTCSTRRS